MLYLTPSAHRQGRRCHCSDGALPVRGKLHIYLRFHPKLTHGHVQVALHQGGIENLFLDSMRASGVEVERPIIPSAIELGSDESELKDPASHPVKVSALTCLANRMNLLTTCWWG